MTNLVTLLEVTAVCIGIALFTIAWTFLVLETVALLAEAADRG